MARNCHTVLEEIENDIIDWANLPYNSIIADLRNLLQKSKTILKGSENKNIKM